MKQLPLGRTALFLSIAAAAGGWVMRLTSTSEDLTPAIVSTFVVMFLCAFAFAFGLLGLIKDEADANGFLVEKRNAWIGLATGIIGFVITFPLVKKLVLD